MKLNSKQLRKSEPSGKDLKKIKRYPIYLILDEIIDTYNIGSLFRLADATGVKKVFLCGKMEYPPSSRIHKAAVGTENWVPWEKRDSTLEVIKELKTKSHPEFISGSEIPKPFDVTQGKQVRNDNPKVQIIAIEQSPNSISYSLLPTVLQLPCAVVAGNESYGIDKKILKECDIITELPMMGINKSFNVWGSAAVILYKILEEI